MQSFKQRFFFLFSDLNVFHSDASRTDSGAQSSGVQFFTVQSPGGHDTHDHQQNGASQNQTMPLFRTFVPGHVAERWQRQAEETSGVRRRSRSSSHTGSY